MCRNIAHFVSERTIFLTVLTVNIVLLMTVRFYPSMDGPSHLYNANLLVHLLKGDSAIINQFFELNLVYIPNWFSHALLALFYLLFPGWCAEKMMLAVYMIGMALSFRLLVKTLNPDNAGLSVFIFPFIHSYLFHLGFYNYCFSFILLFLSIYWWFAKSKRGGIFFYTILCSLLTLAYFSSILTFAFLGLFLGFWIIAETIGPRFQNRRGSVPVKLFLKKLSLLGLVSLPGIVLGAIFMSSSNFSTSIEHYPFDELMSWLYALRPLIVYNYLNEAKLTGFLLQIMIAITSISLFRRFYNTPGNVLQKMRKSDILIPLVLITLLFYIVTPNGASAGMMSDRYCLMAFVLFVIWVSVQTLPKPVSLIFMVMIIVPHAGLLYKHYKNSIYPLDQHATGILNTSKYVDAGSTILPVNFSSNWLELHFSNYLAVDGELIILEKYEASMGWFPINWHTDKMPRLQLGGFDSLSDLEWPTNTKSLMVKPIDYVLLYGTTGRINEASHQALRQILQSSYSLVYSSADKYIALYKKR